MDWTWFFVFIGLMYVMHRFGLGCCGSHNHGSHGGEVDWQDSKNRVPNSSRKEKEELIGTVDVPRDGGEKRM